MGLWVSDLLNSYQSTQVFRTGHYSLPLEGVAGIWIWLCHNKIYLIPLRALQYSDVPPPAPLPPTAHTNNHFIGSQFSIFLTLYSVSNDWSPSTPTANYVISQNLPPPPHPQANDRSLDKTPWMRIWQLVSKMNWALYQCGSQELAGKIDLESYAQMTDFDFSSFSLIHLELKGNVFIRSRSFLTKPNLRSWWFNSVAVFGQKSFKTPSFLAAHPCSIHRGVPCQPIDWLSISPNQIVSPNQNLL